MYNWKINMKNGDRFIVKSDISNSNDFMTLLLGTDARCVNITHFGLVNSKYYDNGEISCESNMVAVISTDISSVEWMSK